MDYLLSGLVYVSFGLVILFGLLTYVKDTKMYPQFPKYFKYSLIAMGILVTLQIFLVFQSLTGVFLWLFFASVVGVIYFVLKMINGKTTTAIKQAKTRAIIAGVLAVGALIGLFGVAYHQSQLMSQMILLLF